MKFIIRPFSEIMVKSKGVRKRYLWFLQHNLQVQFREISSQIKVSVHYDKLEINIRDADTIEKLQPEIAIIEKILLRTPWVESFLEVETHDVCDMDLMAKKAEDVYIDRIKDKTFCVRVKRTGKHEFTSLELERHIWSHLLITLDNKYGIHGKVDVKKPQVTVYMEIKDENLYVVKKTWYWIGWFPIWAQDKVVSLLSGWFDSGVAAFSMMKRGCKVDYLFFNLWGTAHELWVKQVAYYLNKNFSAGYKASIVSVPFENVVKHLVTKTHHKYRGIILKRCMLKVADFLAQKYNYCALVKWDSLGQVSSQTLKNIHVVDKASDTVVLRPLISFNKQEIVDISKQIWTHDFACNMPEYCGVISDRPSVWASVSEVLEEEENFDFSLLDEAIENRSTNRVDDILQHVQDESDEIEYKNFPTDNDVIIDIRDPDSIKKSKLKVDGREVLEIPFYDINNEFSKLDQSKKYLLSCEKWVLSKLHGLYLLEKWFSNVAVFKPLEADKTCGTI